MPKASNYRCFPCNNLQAAKAAHAVVLCLFYCSQFGKFSWIKALILLAIKGIMNSRRPAYNFCSFLAVECLVTIHPNKQSKPNPMRKHLATACCLSFIFTLLALVAHAQPTAQFAAQPASGCAPLLVSFQDQSAGNPTHWRWDLGNNTVSFLQNPVAGNILKISR
ncbi:MAG: hypothetical protein EOP48_02000 [Sphingobacteriales bacterium]|nr:MAG: hypothetical protein EOP48_02000 [Sphingobacteriales bacterium]